MSDHDGLYWLPVREQAALIRNRELSVTELVAAHLDRVGSLNPAVNALITLDPERSMAEAAEADRAVARKQRLGPLHGIPAGFTDSHDTAGMRTTYGSPLFAAHVPAVDDPVIARMRNAGAVTLGKTNVPEFQTGAHTFNQVFGVTRNPYDLTRSAGGSEGGTAAALAAGMIAAGDGSDLGGSLRNSASFCNVVGLRPSPGRVPGLAAPFGWQPLTVRGPIGRTVDDVALILSAISGPDPRCPLPPGQDGPGPGQPRPADLRRLRVAWSPDLAGQAAVDPEVTAVLNTQLATFTAAGCDIQPDCIDFDGADQAFRTLRAWMLAYRMHQHVIDHRDQLKPSLIQDIEEGRFLSGRDVASAMETHTALFQQARRFFDRYDVLALPAASAAPFPAHLEHPAQIAGQPQNCYLDWLAPAYLISMTGCPAITLPAGFTPDGLPVGIQLVAPHHAEHRLLSIALAYEQATGHGTRRPDITSQPIASQLATGASK